MVFFLVPRGIDRIVMGRELTGNPPAEPIMMRARSRDSISGSTSGLRRSKNNASRYLATHGGERMRRALFMVPWKMPRRPAEKIDYHTRLKKKYERAATLPSISVLPVAKPPGSISG